MTLAPQSSSSNQLLHSLDLRCSNHGGVLNKKNSAAMLSTMGSTKKVHKSGSRNSLYAKHVGSRGSKLSLMAEKKARSQAAMDSISKSHSAGEVIQLSEQRNAAIKSCRPSNFQAHASLYPYAAGTSNRPSLSSLFPSSPSSAAARAGGTTATNAILANAMRSSSMHQPNVRLVFDSHEAITGRRASLAAAESYLRGRARRKEIACPEGSVRVREKRATRRSQVAPNGGDDPEEAAAARGLPSHREEEEEGELSPPSGNGNASWSSSAAAPPRRMITPDLLGNNYTRGNSIDRSTRNMKDSYRSVSELHGLGSMKLQSTNNLALGGVTRL